MKSISSKYLSIETVRLLLKINEEKNHIYCNGILLIMPFGIVYGTFMDIDADNPKTVADILASSTSTSKESAIKDNLDIIGDGSQVILKDATVKYPTGITLKMAEISIFCDQICGYYPVDLSVLENQIS